MYYPCSENKGADQLRSYCESDLCLCFRIGKNPVFSRCGSNGYIIWQLVDNTESRKPHKIKLCTFHLTIYKGKIKAFIISVVHIIQIQKFSSCHNMQLKNKGIVNFVYVYT